MELLWRRYFARGHAELPLEMIYAWLACEGVQVGTWEEFNDQPWFVVQAIRTYKAAQAEDEKRRSKQ